VAKAARTPSVIAILGADSFRAEAALEAAVDKALGQERGDAVQVFRGDETTWTRVIDAARTGSLFVARRVVIVRGAELAKGEGDDLLAFIADPPPDVTLILLAKPDKRKTLWKRVCEAVTLVDAEPLKGRALRSYVADEVRRRGLRLGEDALDELLERVGQDLRRLMGELDKLEAYAGKGKSIGADDVAKVLGRGMARPLYRLADAMMARQAAEVLLLMEELLDEGEPALRMLATLHRVVRQTRACRALVAARAPRDVFASKLGIPPFKTGDVIEASRRWSDADLRTAIQALSRADIRIKTGSDPRVALAALVGEACRPAAGGRRAGAR
jgi:DNA polymerase III subunit delta